MKTSPPSFDMLHFGNQACIVALCIGIDGVMDSVAIEKDPTENATCAVAENG